MIREGQRGVLCLTETDNLDELDALETNELFAVMSELYQNIYHDFPYFMRDMDRTELLAWFRGNYAYDILTGEWACVGVLLH